MRCHEWTNRDEQAERTMNATYWWGSPFMKNYDNWSLLYNANDAITVNWLTHKQHASPYLELRAAAIQCECAEFDTHHGAIDRAISLYSDITTISTIMRIHDRQPRRKIEAYEAEFLQPTPSGWWRWFRAPWIHIRTSLRCLSPKRYELCYGVYTPML